MKEQTKTVKIFKTAVLYLSFFALGLCTAIPGPTLLDLQQIVQSETSKITYIYLARSGGYLVGSLIGGVLYDYMKRKQLLLTFWNCLMSVSVLAIPWSRNIVTLVSILAVSGISMGALDCGANVLCLKIWGKESAPYFQALHFLFGVGAFVAPLIAEPFLSEQCNSDLNETAWSNNNNASRNVDSHYNNSMEFKQNKIACPLDAGIPPVTYSYSIIGCYSFFVTIVFAIVAVRWPLENHKKVNDDYKAQESQKSHIMYTIVVAISAQLLIAVYCGVEIGYGQMLATFAVKGDLKLSKSVASYLTAVFWGVFTFTRGISIFLSAKLSAFSLVFGDLIIMIIGCTILITYGSTASEYLFAGTVILAMGLASFYPSAISWIERYIDANSKVLALFVISASAGEMIIPFTVSQYIDSKPLMLMYIMLGSTVTACLMTFAIWVITSRKGDKYTQATVKSLPEETQTII